MLRFVTPVLEHRAAWSGTRWSSKLDLLYNYGMIFYINHFSLIIFYHSVWLGFELFGS